MSTKKNPAPAPTDKELELERREYGIDRREILRATRGKPIEPRWDRTEAELAEYGFGDHPDPDDAWESADTYTYNPDNPGALCPVA